MVPGYGTDLLSLMFEDPDAEEVAAQASIRVRAAMAAHEPGVDLISALPNPTSSGNFAVIDVEYRRLDAADSAVVANANAAIIGANGVVREIVRG